MKHSMFIDITTRLNILHDDYLKLDNLLDDFSQGKPVKQGQEHECMDGMKAVREEILFLTKLIRDEFK